MADAFGDDERTLSPRGELATDTVLDLLADRRRRLAIDRLHRHERPLSLPDLADEVAVREHDAPLPEIDEEAVLRIYLTLYHNHVPKLADADVVEYSQERDLVALAGNADQVIAYLHRVEGDE